MARKSVVVFPSLGKRSELLVVQYGRSSNSRISEMTRSLRNLNSCGTGMITIGTIWCECIGAVEGLDIGVDVVGAELRVQSVK